MGETIHVRGEGGVLWEMDLPLPEGAAHRLANGDLKRVNADGSAYEPEGDDQTMTPAKPAKSAKQGAWVDYAVSLGADRDEVKDLSRGDLVEKYG